MSVTFELILEQNEAFGESAFIGGTALADFDGDGRIEIVAGPFTLPVGPFHDIKVYERQDDGTFVDIYLSLFGDGFAPLVRDGISISTADLNGDGFNDLVVANDAFGPDDQDAVALSDGQGGLINATFEFRQDGGPTHDLAVGDFDGDGRMDVFFSKFTGGSSHFISIDSAGNIESDSIDIEPEVNQFSAVIGTDIDGDGVDEIILGINEGIDPTGNSVIVNIVNGTAVGTDLPDWHSLTGRTDDGVAILDVEVFDANDDGREDILFVGSNRLLHGFDFQLLTQNANGSFTDSTADFFSITDFHTAVPSGEFAAGVEIADLDADGDLDLYLLVDFPFGDRIFFREGDKFVLGEQEFDFEGVGAVVGDVDGDFSPEIFTFSQFNIRGFDNGLQGLPVTEEGVFITGEFSEGTTGADTFNGGNLIDSVSGGNGNDALNGGGGADILNGDRGADILSGGSGGDSLNGGNGNDSIRGDGGSDSILGGGGKDTIVGGGGKDTIEGGGGKDTIEGSGGKDELDGGGGNDLVEGGGGKDVLAGGRGKDTLNGGGGRDDIAGGKGSDLLSGGNGRDTFHFERGSGNDVIEDWRDRQDLIEIDGASFGELTISQIGDDTLIRYTNIRITVEDADADLFTTADFIF